MSSSPVIDSPYLINSAPERVRINFCEGRRDERSDLRNARDRDSFVFRTVAHVHTTLHSQLLAALGRPGIQHQAESGTRVAMQQAPCTRSFKRRAPSVYPNHRAGLVRPSCAVWSSRRIIPRLSEVDG